MPQLRVDVASAEDCPGVPERPTQFAGSKTQRINERAIAELTKESQLVPMVPMQCEDGHSQCAFQLASRIKDFM